jgi:hypothetical protein
MQCHYPWVDDTAEHHSILATISRQLATPIFEIVLNFALT